MHPSHLRSFGSMKERPAGWSKVHGLIANVQAAFCVSFDLQAHESRGQFSGLKRDDCPVMTHAIRPFPLPSE